MNKKGWMIRAGESGRLFEDFEQGYAAVGWNQLGDLKKYPNTEPLRTAYIEHYGNAKPSKTNNAIAMIWKFKEGIAKGDMIITYSPEKRIYLVGEDLGDYYFVSENEADDGYSNRRKVNWLGSVSRDLLTTKTRNSLGSTLTLFSLPDFVINELNIALAGKTAPQIEQETPEELDEIEKEMVARSHELIKDKLESLAPDDMEKMIAAVLRAMGYKTKVSPRGPDRGVDVLASPDGLGLTHPRIKVEVKHRLGSIGAPNIRSFLGALREGDSGLYVSTGGFSKEARYEAERATVPVTLVDIDDLADLIVSHYDKFDSDGRVLLPLTRIYWPAN